MRFNTRSAGLRAGGWSFKATKQSHGNRVPTAGTNSSSDQNPDGLYQLIAQDNCDIDPKIFVGDNSSIFIAGPFHNSAKSEDHSSEGHRP